MDQRFPSSEKLKNKILIDRLFSEGKPIKRFPIKLIYLPLLKNAETTCKTGVSVPKRNFKKAVDRNYLKRLMRESFRKNKYLVENNPTKKYALMFIYIGRVKMDYSKVSETIIYLLQKLIEKEAGHENKVH